MEIQIHCAHDAAIPLADLKPHPQNPNTHPEPQIELLSKIIREQGWRNPIVVSNRSGYIVKGHGRHAAALRLGATHAPVDYQDYASEKDELADMIADNRIAELAELDRSLMRELAEQLDDGAFDMDLTGFDQLALEELMTARTPANGENDPNAEWEGMPEYLNNPKACRTLIVHFKTSDDVTDFLKRLEQEITESTKWIWHPRAEREDLTKIAFVAE